MTPVRVRRVWTPRTRASRAFLFACALLAAGGAPAAAQSAGADTVPRYNLDSVLVTVLKAPMRLGVSAYPVSVISSRDLRQGKTGMFLEEALQGLPGVQVQNRFNYAVGERVTIRGFGSRAQFGVRGIQVIVDGIPATLPDGQSTLDHVDIGSLGRVEALRGPASALYGNASGGVLRFETEIPSDAPAREELTVVGGSDGLLRLQSKTSGTVGQTGYLVSLNRLSYDGFRHDANGDPYGSADRLHLNARLEQPLGPGELGITLNHVDLDSENPGALALAPFQADPTQVAATYTNFQTGKEVQQSQLGLTWTGPVGDLMMETAAYGLARDFLNPLPADVADLDRRAGGARVLLGGTTTSGSVGIDLRGGVSVDLQNDDRREYTNSSGRPDVLQQNQTETVRSVGLFFQAALSLGERVNVLGGVRYDATRFEVEDLFPVTPGTNEDDSGERSMDAFSPTLGVHVEATPELGFFANFATSFETPTTVELGNRESGSGGFNPDLDPQTGRSFELGARGAIQERISYEVSAFRIRLTNELISFLNADDLTYYRNAGSSVRKGVEATVGARLHPLLTGQASYAHTDARFEEYVKSGNDLSGNRVPGLAPTQLQASLRMGPAAWYVEVGAERTGDVEVNDENNFDPADAYTLFGVRVGGEALRLGRLEVSPFAGIQNLTDETYVASLTVNAFVPPTPTGLQNTRYYEPGPGRTFYLGGRVAVSR